ncbi:MAG TPA: glutamine amidotransferase [Candidatus Saccharimonadales bacterium]|nr:glutamine amidotransferase [Candidatus Saccharimonadales bacterium]
MNEKLITILHLYPRDMNIYGDYGNILTLKRRLEWRGYTTKIIDYNQGDSFPDDIDILVGGGGQDSGQNKIQADLLKIAPRLKKLADDGTPMLVICGLYQLFGTFFETIEGDVIEGIDLFDAKTYGRAERLTGNIIVNSQQFGDIVGYENHSGQTFLGKNAAVLGRVRLGAGNNVTDVSEGARYKNVIGSYLHGPLLPKNPKIADFLIETAVAKRYGSFKLKDIDDTHVSPARKIAQTRPR